MVIKKILIGITCSTMIMNHAGNVPVREAINLCKPDIACALAVQRAKLENIPASAEDFFRLGNCSYSIVLLKRAQLFGGSLAQVRIVDLQPNCTSAQIRGTVADTLTDNDLLHIFTPTNVTYIIQALNMIVFAAAGECHPFEHVLARIGQAEYHHQIPSFYSPLTPWDDQVDIEEYHTTNDHFADQFFDTESFDKLCSKN